MGRHRLMTSPPSISPVPVLEERLNARWNHIAAARELSVQTRSKLNRQLQGVDSDDCSVVVSGSLARDEFTPGSDIDWTLLIDGQADPDVIESLPRIKSAASGLATKSVGREGTFGEMAFSIFWFTESAGRMTRTAILHSASFCSSSRRPSVVRMHMSV
jgi:predicted nucleotidyltransferase